MDARATALLRTMGQAKAYHHDAFVFVEGDRAATIYLVESGQVRLSIISESGRELTLAIARPGDVIGEADAILGQNRTCQARVSRPNTRVRVIAWAEVMRHPEARVIWTALLRVMSERAIARDRRIVQATYESAPIRIARALNDLAAGDGRVIVSTHNQIAELAGCSREVATRVLGHFEYRGLIRRAPGHRILVDRPIDLDKAQVAYYNR